MKQRIIHFKVYKGDKYYIAESIDLPIVTQGKTIDEVVANIKEALSLHLEGENYSEFNFVHNPSVLINLELEAVYA